MLLRRETLLALGLAAFLTAGQVKGQGNADPWGYTIVGNAESAESTADAAFGFEIGNAMTGNVQPGVVDPAPWLILLRSEERQDVGDREGLLFLASAESDGAGDSTPITGPDGREWTNWPDGSWRSPDGFFHDTQHGEQGENTTPGNSTTDIATGDLVKCGTDQPSDCDASPNSAKDDDKAGGEGASESGDGGQGGGGDAEAGDHDGGDHDGGSAADAGDHGGSDHDGGSAADGGDHDGGDHGE